MSALRSPSKSPTTASSTHLDTSIVVKPTSRLVMLNVPSPFENATGRVLQPIPPISAMSVFPSLLKSPTSFLPAEEAHAAKSPTNAFVTRNVPSPFENATGSVFQPAPPTSAMSAYPSLLKSPTNALTPGCDAQLPNAPTGEFGTRHVPAQ